MVRRSKRKEASTASKALQMDSSGLARHKKQGVEWLCSSQEGQKRGAGISPPATFKRSKGDRVLTHARETIANKFLIFQLYLSSKSLVYLLIYSVIALWVLCASFNTWTSQFIRKGVFLGSSWNDLHQGTLPEDAIFAISLTTTHRDAKSLS